MICTNCKKAFDENTNFCSNCGMKIDIQSAEEYTNKSNDNSLLGRLRNSFLLTNIIIYKLFLACFVVMFVKSILIIGSIDLSDPVMGWLLIFSPVLIGILVFPQAIGYILARRNLKSKKYWLLILMFIMSLFSFLESIYFLENTILAWISLCVNTLLVLMLLLKLVYKIKD